MCQPFPFWVGFSLYFSSFFLLSEISLFLFHAALVEDRCLEAVRPIPHPHPRASRAFCMLLQLYPEWTSQNIWLFLNDLSSKMYFHSNYLYFYREINQKGLFKFKGRTIVSPWFDDTVVQFWNTMWFKRHCDYLWKVQYANNPLFSTVDSSPHTSLLQRILPKFHLIYKLVQARISVSCQLNQIHVQVQLHEHSLKSLLEYSKASSVLLPSVQWLVNSRVFSISVPNISW